MALAGLAGTEEGAKSNRGRPGGPEGQTQPGRRRSGWQKECHPGQLTWPTTKSIALLQGEGAAGIDQRGPLGRIPDPAQADLLGSACAEGATASAGRSARRAGEQEGMDRGLKHTAPRAASPLNTSVKKRTSCAAWRSPET